MKSLVGRYLEFIDDESGNVESALVIIPLLLLFLSILQIAASSMARSTANNLVQGDVSRTALLNSQNGESTWQGTKILDGSAVNKFSLPLSGGGSLIVSERLNSLPILTPLLINRDQFMSTGIAVDENP